jgi:hypothetical protein
VKNGVIFLAYARADRARANKLEKALTKQGFRFSSDSQLVPGQNWELTIADNLREAAVILLLVSNAAQASTWVQREVEYASASGKPIVPLLIEGDPLPALAHVQHADLRSTDKIPEALIEELRRKTATPDKVKPSAAAAGVLEALDNRKLGGVLEEIQQVLVLLLGNFSGKNLDRLLRLQGELQGRDLHPVIFDFERPSSSDYGETVRLLAGLSGFVIADMSDPRSVVMELQLIAPDLAVPIIPIVSTNHEPVALFTDLLVKYDWVLPPRRYRDVTHLVNILDREIIEPARKKRQDLVDRKAESALAQTRDLSEP